MAIKTVLVDLGGVIVRCNFSVAYEALASLKKEVTPRQVEEAIMETGLYRNFELGRMKQLQFCGELRQALGLPHELDNTVQRVWSQMFTRIETTITTLKRVPEEVRLIIASNTNPFHHKQLEEQLSDLLPRFSDMVLSFSVGHMKPAREFYDACLEKAHCEPGDCFFIDDRPENVRAAQAVGIPSIVFSEATTNLAREFSARGVQLKNQ